MKDYCHYSISDLSQLLKTQKVSSVDVVTQCLERIAKAQPHINAFITVFEQEALAAAKQADKDIAAGNWRGPLHGIPVALKDMYDMAGSPTTAGFEHFAHRIPTKDAAAVTNLKEAGAIIIGKTNMHTLAMGTTSLQSFYGPVKNPWNTEYIAGGSSGGSAAAVAAGLCFATVDTDAVGSCRLPAACCGVVGYKCTWGLIDNSGILDGEQADPVILQLAAVGVQARHVEDVAIVATVLSQKDLQADDTVQRIGIVTNFGATEAVRAHTQRVADTLAGQGFTVVPVSAPFSEAPDMAAMDEARATAARDVFADVDILLLPTLAVTVPKAADLGPDPQALSPQNTFFANYLGLPAISLPSGIDPHGLPLSVQLVGKPQADAQLLAVAAAVLKTMPAMDYSGLE